MARFGNRNHALAVLRTHRNNEAPPEGFRLVGTGAFRFAYLHIATGIVYKVDGCRDQWTYTNKAEVKNARRLAAFAWNAVRIPKVDLYMFRGEVPYNMLNKSGTAYVVAMEFIDAPLGREVNGSYTHKGRLEFQDKMRELGYLCSDMHGANFIIDKDDMFVPIDLAS